MNEKISQYFRLSVRAIDGLEVGRQLNLVTKVDFKKLLSYNIDMKGKEIRSNSGFYQIVVPELGINAVISSVFGFNELELLRHKKINFRELGKPAVPIRRGR